MAPDAFFVMSLKQKFKFHIYPVPPMSSKKLCYLSLAVLLSASLTLHINLGIPQFKDHRKGLRHPSESHNKK